MAQNKNNTAEIGFEKEIWDTACILRGNLDAAEYKQVVLGLIFLKYISDRFEEKYNALVEEGDGFEEDIDEYMQLILSGENDEECLKILSQKRKKALDKIHILEKQISNLDYLKNEIKNNN